MPASSPSIVRCLDALFRYELAAAHCYRFAENVLTAERDALIAVRRSHEFAAATLHQQIVVQGQSTSDGPGLSGALPTLVKASTVLSARWAVLTVLLGTERHGIATYSAACRIPVLPATACVTIESTLLPLMHGHVRTLEQMASRPTNVMPDRKGRTVGIVPAFRPPGGRRPFVAGPSTDTARRRGPSGKSQPRRKHMDRGT